ncbi:MAG: hypothetical protein ACLP5V_09920 [Candidatus Bathyarchaeia archaeon]
MTKAPKQAFIAQDEEVMVEAEAPIIASIVASPVLSHRPITIRNQFQQFLVQRILLIPAVLGEAIPSGVIDGNSGCFEG